jgi:filamentous hemagglutinin family protein
MNSQFPAGACPPHARALLALAVLLSIAGLAQAAPVGGVVAAGAATIGAAGARTTITQASGSAVINWQGFGIAAGEAVQFKQPGPSSVTLNRVVGGDPSAIFGSLSANGKVFLVNPNGILFGAGAAVNVGGLVASTLDLRDADFMAGRYRFSGTSRAAVVNEGTLNADGGFVALLGSDVSNNGVISTRLGNTVLAAGEAITLDVLGDNLLQVTIDRGAVDAAVRNGGLIQADGGQVLLTTQAVGAMLSSVVNNTGVIRAQTLSTQGGTIRLMADMGSGSVLVAGTLDASAPNGGNGGFIETSAARVRVQDGARVTTAASAGRTGEWLLDPQDFTIGSGATDNISGPTLSALLVTNSVVISTATGPDATVPGTPPVTSLNTAVNGNGDIHVNEAVSWTAAPSTTTLTLNAARDVNINRAITAVNGNFVACCGRDVNVNAPIVTTNGSVLVSAGRNANFSSPAAMTTTDGNMMICAANDISIASALTLTRGSIIPAQSLGLQPGLVLSAGTGGTGPGVGGGTLIFSALAPKATATGAVGNPVAVTVNYNPSGYTTPTDYAPRFTLTNAILTQHMLVFAISPDKFADGTTVTTLAGLKGNPAGVTLVAGPASVANFESTTPGAAQAINFSGYTLAGAQAASYALPVACCGPTAGQARTTGALLAAALPVVVPTPAVPVVITPPPVAPVPVTVVPVPVVIVAPPVVVVTPPVVVVTPPLVIAPPATVIAAPAVAPIAGPVPDAAPAPAPAVVFTASSPDAVIPQFTPFVVAPMLLQAPMPLLLASPARAQPMQLVLAQQPAPAPSRAAAVPEAAPATALPAPAAPAAARPAKPFRN